MRPSPFGRNKHVRFRAQCRASSTAFGSSLKISPADSISACPAYVSWLDPELECVPVKDAFDWVYDQTEKLGDLTMLRLNQANDAHDKFGEYIIRWYRLDDLPETEPLGLQNLASHLVSEQLKVQGIEVSFVYACRDDEWIEQHLDDFPDIDPKAVSRPQPTHLG